MPHFANAWGRPAAALTLALLALGGLLPGTPGTWRLVGVLELMAFLAAIGWSAWRVTGALLPEVELCSRTVAALTVAVAEVTCTATLLGHFGHLHAGPFLILIGVFLAGSLYLPPVAAVTGPWLEPLAPAGIRSLATVERALLLAAAGALILRLGGSLVHVTVDPGAFVSYDDLSYHLPAVAVWQQAGDLRTLKFETGDPSTTFYPFVSELCSWALLAPLRDSDLLARRAEVWFALGSLVAVAALARRLGLSRRAALLAVLLYATVDRAFPVLALGAGNDHTTAFFTLAGLDGGLSFLRRPGRRSAVYTGAALGLLIGTKYIGLLYAATVAGSLAAVWEAGLVRATPPRGRLLEPSPQPRASLRPVKDLVVPLGILGLVAVLCGGYAYLRNAWTAGNPVFPAALSVLGHPILPGWSGATLEWRRQLPEFQIDIVSFLTRRADLFGPLFSWTMLPSAFLGPALALARRRPQLAVVFALPIVFFLEFRFLMHDHRDLRYILPALAVAALAAAWVLWTPGPRLGGTLRGLALVGILLAAASHLRLGAPEEALLLALLFTLSALAVVVAGRHPSPWTRCAPRPSPQPRLAACAAGLAAILVVALAGSLGVDRYQSVKLAGQPAALALEQLTGGNGSQIAYVGSNEPYLFFGRRLQNDVQVVPTDGDLPAQYYFWGGSARFPFDRPSAGQWRANLASRNISFVVAARTPAEGPERGWMAAAPREFGLIYAGEQVEIWRIRGGPGPAHP